MRVENERPTVHDTLLLITLCSCLAIFRPPPSDLRPQVYTAASIDYISNAISLCNWASLLSLDRNEGAAINRSPKQRYPILSP